MPHGCLASAVHPRAQGCVSVYLSVYLSVSLNVCVRVCAREKVCLVFEPRKDEKREESCEAGIWVRNEGARARGEGPNVK
jgi:hypothetical protein